MFPIAYLDSDNDTENKLNPKLINSTKSSFIARVAKSRGIIYALCAAFLIALSNILVRKNKLFSGNENALVRYIIQVIVMLPLAIIKKQKIFGDKEQRLMLSLRGIFACIGLIAFYSAISLISPSDATALFNCCVLFITLFSRIFLKEKLTLVHLTALVITFVGVLFITQPDVLFLKNKNLTNQTNENTTLSRKTSFQSDYKILGVILALGSSLAFAFVSVIIKHLANKKAHISTVLLYASYFGIPCSLLTSLVMINTGLEERLSFRLLLTSTNNLRPDVYLILVTAVISVVSQILINLALQLEEASKVAILKSTDLIFTFFLQHFILDIHPNIFNSLGAFMIFLGASTVLIYKIADKRHSKKLISTSDIEMNSSSTQQNFRTCLSKILFYKF